MGPRPWERASRAPAATPAAYRARATQGVAKARTNVVARRHVPARQPSKAAAAGQHEKIPGTNIKKLKGGAFVRVVHASGREFAPNDVLGVRSHLEKLGRTGQAAPVQRQPTKWAGQGVQKTQLKGQIVAKNKTSTAAGKFASNLKVKGQKFQVSSPSPSAAGGLKFKLPQSSGTVTGVKFKLKPTAKVVPTAKVACMIVKKKIIKTIPKSGNFKNKAIGFTAAKSEGEDERHMLKIEDEGRMLVNNAYFTGKVVSCGNTHAWVLPLRPSIPAKALPKLTKMNDDYRAANRADTNWSSSWRPFAGGTKENVVYVALADVEEEGLKLRDGISVRFKLYTDSKGVGGCEVISA